MPYKSSDVPSGTEKVPGHGQAIYRGAFNAAYEKYGEEKAHAIAWAAVKHKYKKKGDEWVSKDALKLPDFWSEESRIAAAEAKKAKAKEKPGSDEKRKRYEKANAEYEKQLRENGENHPKTVAAERAMLKAHREYGVVHRGERGGGALKWSATGYHDGDLPGHPFRGNQYTSGQGSGGEGPEHTGGLSGSGGPLQSITHPGHGYSKAAYLDSAGVIHTNDVYDASRALYEGRKVELNQPRTVSTLVDHLGKVAAEMAKLGVKSRNFDLCNVSVKGTNLFCAESLGIPRQEMPQLTDQQTADFRDHLAKTYEVKDTTEKASYLRATQNQLIGAKVANAVKLINTVPAYANRRIMVSKDNYILDGHHTWAGHLAVDAANGVIGDRDMNITRVDIPITKLLEEADTFTEGKGKRGVGAGDSRKDFVMDLDLLDIKPCPTCDGAGKDGGGFKCKTCDGEGYVKDARRMQDPDDDDDDDDDDSEDLGDARIQMHDSFVLDGKPRKTKDGYLVARARIARTGIQEYLGSELGMPHMDVVRVYRPPSEVFNKQALRSMATLPITLDHPPCMVNSGNWKQYAIGDTGEDVARDGECIRVPLIIKDANAIRAYEKDGVRELSVGYSTDLKWKKGNTPDGEPFDAIQTAIRGNHLAVVPAARGGSRLRIGDHGKGEDTMIRVLIDGQSIEFHDELVAKHVQTYLASLQKIIADQKAKCDTGEAEKEQEAEKKIRAEKDAAAKDGEIAVLKKQLDDARAQLTEDALDKRTAARLDLRMKAATALDGKVDFTGKTDAEVRRLVVAAKIGDAAKVLTDDQIAGAFVYAISDIKPQNGTDRLADGLAMLQFGGTISQNDPKALKDAAYNEYVQRTQNAWRSPPRAA